MVRVFKDSQKWKVQLPDKSARLFDSKAEAVADARQKAKEIGRTAFLLKHEDGHMEIIEVT